MSASVMLYMWILTYVDEFVHELRMQFWVIHCCVFVQWTKKAKEDFWRNGNYKEDHEQVFFSHLSHLDPIDFQG